LDELARSGYGEVSEHSSEPLGRIFIGVCDGHVENGQTKINHKRAIQLLQSRHKGGMVEAGSTVTAPLSVAILAQAI